MATKKTDTKTATTEKPKKVTATYKGKEYTVLDRNEHKVCLTDGMIHFWVKANDVQD